MAAKFLEAIWWLWCLAVLLVLLNHSKPWFESMFWPLLVILVALAPLIEVIGATAFANDPNEAPDREI